MRPLALSTVLVASDLRSTNDVALEAGYRLADAAGAALHVVHVRESLRADDDGSERRRLTDALHALVRGAGIPDRRARVHVVAGSPATAVRALSEELDADVIVVGPPHDAGDGGAEHRLGGTARAIAEGACAPCLTTMRPLPLPLKRVLVPTDFSETARGALLVGLSWASALRATPTADHATTLLALHVTQEQRAAERRDITALEEELEMLRQNAGSWAGVRIEALPASGGSDVAESIVLAARDHRADLVVMGTRGIGLDQLRRLGSVSALVVERSPVSVLLVPPSVWKEHLAE